MPATTYKGYEVQVTGSNTGVWGDVLNDDVIDVVDRNVGGTVTKTLSSSNISLSATESQHATLRLTGTLTANVQVTTACVGHFYCENLTTGNFAVTITNGFGATVIPPQYSVRHYISDLTNGIRAVGLAPVGTIVDYGGQNGLTPDLAGEYVLAYGQDVSRTALASLFALYGGVMQQTHLAN